MEPSFPRRREPSDFALVGNLREKQRRWVPAFAGMTIFVDRTTVLGRANPDMEPHDTRRLRFASSERSDSIRSK